MFRIRSRAGRTFVGPNRAALRRTFTSPERIVMRRSVVALLRPSPAPPARRGGEGGQVNVDNDHYFCVPKTAGASADLSNAFKTAATSLAQGTKLVELP